MALLDSLINLVRTDRLTDSELLQLFRAIKDRRPDLFDATKTKIYSEKLVGGLTGQPFQHGHGILGLEPHIWGTTNLQFNKNFQLTATTNVKNIVEENNIIVWDLDFNLDFQISNNQNIDWFESSEVVKGLESESYVKSSTKKKIVLVNYWKGYDTTVRDLGWADLIVCFTTEIIDTNYSVYYSRSISHFKNNKIIFLVGGKILNNPVPEDLVLFPNLGFLTRVSMANDQTDYDYHQSRPFIFDALLGQTKNSRLKLFNKLKDLDLLDKCLVNIEPGIYSSNYPDDDGQFTYRSPNLNELEDPIVMEMRTEAKGNSEEILSSKAVNRFYKNTELKVWASQVVPANVYKNSWYSIVGETQTENIEFITEKTLKCFYGKRIFVCLAAPGHLALLRKLGFKTFAGIIDESYDLEPDLIRRIDLIGEQIKFLAQIDPVETYEKATPIIEHNFNLINDISWNLTRIKNFIKPHLDRLK